MIDDNTLVTCKENKEILRLKIKNLEHGIHQAEVMIAESKLDNEAIIYLRRKVAESMQDLEILYLLNPN